MLRERLSKREAEVQNGFRLRGLGEVSRVEALSGISYWLIAPVMFLHGYARGRRREQHLAHDAESPLNVPAG